MKNKFKQIENFVFAFFISLNCSPIKTYANYFKGITESNDKPAFLGEDGLIKQVCNICKCGGLVILVWGLADLVIALKDDNVNDKKVAAFKMFAGIMLVTIDTLLNEVGATISV